MTTPFNTRSDLAAHPEFSHLSLDSSGIPCVWLNTYECDNGHEPESWSEAWSCCCDDECPVCGTDMSPVSTWIGPESGDARDLWEDLPDVPEQAEDVGKEEDGMKIDRHLNAANGLAVAPRKSQAWHDVVEEIMVETRGLDDNARRAARALRTIYPEYDDDTAKTGIMDCLADIRHLCDLMGWSFAELDKDAHYNYSTEVSDFGVAEHAKLRSAVEAELN